MMKIISDGTKFKELGSRKNNLTTIQLEKRICKISKDLLKIKNYHNKTLI